MRVLGWTIALPARPGRTDHANRRVVGHAIATVKHPSMTGWRLLVVQILTADGKPDGEPILAIDTLGAGSGDRVILCNDGAGARQLVEAQEFAGPLVRDGNVRRRSDGNAHR